MKRSGRPDEYDNCWGHQFVWSPYYLLMTHRSPGRRGLTPVPGRAQVHLLQQRRVFVLCSIGHPNKWWSAVGVLPYNSAADYDLRLYDIGNYTGSEAGFGGGYLEYSTWGGATSDFVIVNRQPGACRNLHRRHHQQEQRHRQLPHRRGHQY
jgi:hypothetical protein